MFCYKRGTPKTGNFSFFLSASEGGAMSVFQGYFLYRHPWKTHLEQTHSASLCEMWTIVIDLWGTVFQHVVDNFPQWIKSALSLYIDGTDLVWIEKFIMEKKDKGFRVICLRNNNTKLNVQKMTERMTEHI